MWRYWLIFDRKSLENIIRNNRWGLAIFFRGLLCHYSDVIMGVMASQITSLPIVYSSVYSGADQIKHQSSASLTYVRGIHRWSVNSPHKRPLASLYYIPNTLFFVWIIRKFTSVWMKVVRSLVCSWSGMWITKQSYASFCVHRRKYAVNKWLHID